MGGMLKTTRISALLLCASLGWTADNVPADASGSGLLKGKYWVREIVRLAGTTFSGAITFDGKGAYTFTGHLTATTGQGKVENSQVTVNGTYRVGASGTASVDNLTRSDDLLFAS